MKARRNIAAILISIAHKICNPRLSYTFIKPLFGDWMIMDACLIRQSAGTCKLLKNEIVWESWALPDEFVVDMLNEKGKQKV